MTIAQMPKSMPRTCFLMTRLGKPVPEEIQKIRKDITKGCRAINYELVDAQTKVTGRDFLLKIWKLIAATPLSVGILHYAMPKVTQENIFYELGVAQALGKETLIVKCAKTEVPSDFKRSEYIEYNSNFHDSFSAYAESIFEAAEGYELVSEQLERNPICYTPLTIGFTGLSEMIWTITE